MPSTMLYPGVDADQRGRARAMRSRRSRALARKKSIRCPAWRATRSRGYCDVVQMHGHGRRGPVALQELVEDREVRRLALVHREAARPRDDLDRLRRGLRLGGEAEEIRLEDVGHDESGRGGERAVDRGHGITPVDVELAHRLVEVGNGFRGGAGEHDCPGGHCSFVSLHAGAPLGYDASGDAREGKRRATPRAGVPVDGAASREQYFLRETIALRLAAPVTQRRPSQGGGHHGSPRHPRRASRREGTWLHARGQRQSRASPVHRRADRAKSGRQPRPGRDGAPDASRLRAPRRRPGPRGGEVRRCRQAARLCHRPRGLQRQRPGRARQVLRRHPFGVDGTGRASPGRPRHAHRGRAGRRPRRLAPGEASPGEVQRRKPIRATSTRG